MATSLLRLGRLGSLKLESWGVLRNRSAALFCTQVETPAKPVKKTKAASKTAQAPDERATLLSYKTAVAFPLKLSEPGVFLTQSLGTSEPVASPTEETIAGAAAPASAGAVAEPAVAEAEAAEAPDPDVAHITADSAPPTVDASLTAAELLADASSKASLPDDTPVAAPTTDDVVPSTPCSSEPSDPAADRSSSSSSSSDSDSDSDSDCEDEKSAMKTETKTSPEFTVKDGAEVKEVTSNEANSAMKTDLEEPEVSSSFTAETVQEATPAAALSGEAGPASMDAPYMASEEIEDLAPEICTATEDTLEGTVTSREVSTEAGVGPTSEEIQDVVSSAVPDAQVETPAQDVTKAAASEKVQTDTPIETTEPACVDSPEQAASEPVEPAADPLEDSIEAPEPAPAEAPIGTVLEEAAEAPAEVPEASPVDAAMKSEAAEASPAEAAIKSEAAEASPVEAAIKSEAAESSPVEAAPAAAAAEAAVEAEACAPVESTEELVDTAPVIAEAAGEELQAEPPAEPSEEAAAAAPPEPEEPFDNSTYRNCQHHNYNPYTFADLDVEMAKFRLPQPSSIKH